MGSLLMEIRVDGKFGGLKDKSSFKVEYKDEDSDNSDTEEQSDEDYTDDEDQEEEEDDDDYDDLDYEELKGTQEGEGYNQPLEIARGIKGKGLRKEKKVNSCWTRLNGKSVPLETTLKCVSAYYAQLLSRQTNPPNNELVNDLIQTSTLFQFLAKRSKNPTQDQIYQWLSPFFSNVGLTSENVIIMMVYLERLCSCSKITLAPDNWAILMLGAMLIATKVWHDLSIWNVDFCGIFREISLQDIDILERFYLRCMDYNVGVKSNLFAQRYFELRDFALRNGSAFDLKGLSDSDAIMLESRTALFAKNLEERKKDNIPIDLFVMKKSKSENFWI